MVNMCWDNTLGRYALMQKIKIAQILLEDFAITPAESGEVLIADLVILSKYMRNIFVSGYHQCTAQASSSYLKLYRPNVFLPMGQAIINVGVVNSKIDINIAVLSVGSTISSEQQIATTFYRYANSAIDTNDYSSYINNIKFGIASNDVGAILNTNLTIYID